MSQGGEPHISRSRGKNRNSLVPLLSLARPSLVVDGRNLQRKKRRAQFYWAIISRRKFQLWNFLVQKFVAEAAGADVRCFVIGNRVVGAMRRRAAEGEFRSNLHRGGTAEPVKLTKVERDTARKAARVLGLKVAGVDLLQSDSGPKVLEVNSSPGLEGIETSTSIDVADQIYQFLESRVRPLSKQKDALRVK